jgi:hypothetical protein
VKIFHVEVRSYVEVRLDETKFTPEFMQEFRDSFYPFMTLKAHAEHLAQLAARELIPENSPEAFVEGYGKIQDMGISIDIRGGDQSAVEVPTL